MSLEAAQTRQPNTQPLWFAGFIAAVSVPFACWVVTMIIEVTQGSSPFGAEVMQSLATLMIIGVPLSLIVMFVFGYPLTLLLRHFGKLAALNVCASGLAIGTLLALSDSRYLPAREIDIELVLFCGGAGLFAGIVFCVVARIPFGRPIA